MQAIVITCHDLEDRVAITPTLVQGVLQICDRNRFPKLKSLDVFGVSSCTWWLTGAEEVEMLLRKVSERLAMPDVAVRVMS
ncbi:hypothetical protein BD410DRAFT_788588 [Rickenella mellea]|uniref:Uncharacterized protein n=1 Tax=Rickenella mellea TaxID=50990 RepID=A0A4Y7Q4M3_9AGAM|nr:hypothetical protein BD410DRAFT_788588 [Rickenella mellea]